MPDWIAYTLIAVLVAGAVTALHLRARPRGVLPAWLALDGALKRRRRLASQLCALLPEADPAALPLRHALDVLAQRPGMTPPERARSEAALEAAVVAASHSRLCPQAAEVARLASALRDGDVHAAVLRYNRVAATVPGAAAYRAAQGPSVD